MKLWPVIVRALAQEDVAHALDLPGLRCWPHTRYPYLVFYLQQQDHIDMWRVLHATRDIPAWLIEENAPMLGRRYNSRLSRGALQRPPSPCDIGGA